MRLESCDGAPVLMVRDAKTSGSLVRKVWPLPTDDVRHASFPSDISLKQWEGERVLSLIQAVSARIVCLVIIALLGASAASAIKPQRIASLNLCTDQLLMMLVEPDRIATVSNLARDPSMSVLHKEAAKLPINHAQAEEVFVLQPDLVLAGTFTAHATVNILKRVGRRVEQFAPAYSFDDIRENLRRIGDLVGERAKAEVLIAEFDRDLAGFKADQPTRKPLAAFYYANSYTSGGETLTSEVLEAAGMRNLGRELGLTQTKKLPLEMLVVSNPELVIQGQDFELPALAQEVFVHPALQYLKDRSDEALVAGSHTICGTPFTLRAVQRLAEARQRLSRRTAAKLESAPSTEYKK